MKPFNKDRALAGHPVQVELDKTFIARDFKEYIVGDKAVLSCLVEKGGEPFCVLLVGESGRILADSKGDAAQFLTGFSLYMAEREITRYINVFACRNNDILTSEVTYDTEDEAQEAGKRVIDNISIDSYVTIPITVKL